MEKKKRDNRKTGGCRKKAALTCAAALSCALALGGCGSGEGKGPGKDGEEAQKDTSILVETASPQTESIELDGDFIGTVESDDEITVMAKIGGDVTATYFEEGDRVNAGDLLFTIDDRSAQISMAQAQAGLASANASVNSAGASLASAQANVSVNELNLLYTQEQIKQSLGQVDTNQMQLENAVAAAKYALKAAQENESLAAEQFGLARDNYEDLEDSLDDLRDNADHMGKYAKELEQIRTKYKEIKNASDTDAAKGMLNGMGITVSDDRDTVEKIADYYIYEMTDGAANDEYTLGVMVSAAQSQESTLRSSRESLDGNKDSLRLNQISAAISKETAKNNVYSAEDSLKLAEKMLEDYELYTKAVVIAGANYQLAGSNAGLIAAQAGETQAQAGVAQAQAGVAQAQAGVDAAQLQLEYTKVTAPVSGVITSKNVTVNNMATQGMAAYVITPDDVINISFYVSESVMRELSIGQEVRVERNGEQYTAQITENAGVADDTNGLFEVKAKLTDNSDRLITGTSVKLTLATQKAENVMTIPVDSVYYESQQAYVYCAENGKAVRTQIETGITNNESVEVKSGLTQDSQVITTWAAQLKDGSDIRISGADAGKEEGNTQGGSGSGEGDPQGGSEGEEAIEAADAGELTDTQRLDMAIQERIMQKDQIEQ